MDESILRGLKNFDEVWRRVMDSASGSEGGETAALKPPSSSEEVLSEAISRCREIATIYAGLYCTCRDNFYCGMLRSLARDIKLLRLELFMQSGECVAPETPVPGRPRLPYSLREAYLKEMELSRFCETAAESDGMDERVRRTLNETASCCRERAGELRGCLCRLFNA